MTTPLYDLVKEAQITCYQNPPAVMVKFCGVPLEHRESVSTALNIVKPVCRVEDIPPKYVEMKEIYPLGQPVNISHAELRRAVERRHALLQKQQDKGDDVVGRVWR
jgi:hypothetical protein